MRKYMLLLVLCASFGATAEVGAQLIQLRPLPANGERGRLSEPQAMPLVKIGSRVLRLAPGGVIYDQQNRFILHGNLPAGAYVLFTRDSNHDIQRLYVLSDDERTRLDQAGRR